MDSRQPAANSTVSPSRTAGDALCKVAFVDVDLVKAPPRTSCRSAASSDSDESLTSSSPTMTSSSRDSDDDLPASSTSTWMTYVYFYPRHDMTYTHCLLSTSRRINCDVQSSTSACWPSLPGKHAATTGGSPRKETVSPGTAGRWRRRVNAARTPFWFPVARSYDTAAPAYFYYPRHDLSYAEVEASRVDRHLGVDQSSLPFDTILEELADDAAGLDDWSYVLEDRKSLLDECDDVVPQLPRSAVRDDLRSTPSSLSACHSDEEPTQKTISRTSDNAIVAIIEEAEESQLSSDDREIHEISPSDRTVSPRYQTVDALLTPITKLDLRSLELVTPRQRVDSGRSRCSPVSDKVPTVVRRSSSEHDVRRASGRQSPVRKLPLSARVVKNRKWFSAVDENRSDDATADGDQASCSPLGVVPLRAKHAVTCLLHHWQSTENSAPRRQPKSYVVADVAATNNADAAVSHTHQFPVPVASFAVMSSLSVAAEVQRHITNDQVKNIDRMEDDRPGKSTVDVPVTLTDDIAWNVRAETTSPEMTSPDGESLFVCSPSLDLSTSSSEYLTPPTGRLPEMHHTTTAVTASGTVTTVCDAMSKTPPDNELYSSEIQSVRHGQPPEDELITDSCTLTRLCRAGSAKLINNAQIADPEHSQLVTGSSWVKHGCEATSIDNDVCLELNRKNMITAGTTVTCLSDATSPVLDQTAQGTKILHLLSLERNGGLTATDARVCDRTVPTVYSNTRPIYFHSRHPSSPDDRNTVKTSPTVTRISGVLSQTMHTVVPATDVHQAHSRLLEENKSVTASAIRTRVRDITPAAVNIDVSLTEVQRPDRKPSGRERKHGRPVVADACRHSPDKRRPSTSTFRESKLAPARRQPGRRSNIERISPDSLADVGGLTAYVAALTPRNQHQSRRPTVEHRLAGCRRTPPSKSYVNIWRKRVATYEAFVNRCHTSTTAAAGSRCQHGVLHRL